MKIKKLIKSSLPFVLLCTSCFTQAASVDIINYGSPEIQKTVIGVWATNEKISFQSAGKYSILLTDFGLTQQSFGNNFNHLGAMVSSSYGNLGSVTFDKNSTNPNAFLTFDVTTAGDYWLSLFAITDSSANVGTFNVSMLQGDVSPVPLPAAFWFMATSLLGLVSFARQNRASRKLNDINTQGLSLA
jgi:hypothetical protein